MYSFIYDIRISFHLFIFLIIGTCYLLIISIFSWDRPLPITRIIPVMPENDKWVKKHNEEIK